MLIRNSNCFYVIWLLSSVYGAVCPYVAFLFLQICTCTMASCTLKVTPLPVRSHLSITIDT